MATASYLILGGRGMLGADLSAEFPERSVTAPPSSELDIRDAAAVADAARGVDVVINAAAYTHVDDAEAHEAE
ncbi:MAG: sugar nucleotide-binding protein, partial [Pseudolysinimonas sp.]